MLTIQNIELTDLEQFALLCDELFGAKTNRLNLAQSLEKIMANPAYILIGAKDNGQLIGTVMGIVCFDTVGECQPFMVLENLIVNKNSHRQGVGKMLVNYLEDRAREQNCYYIMLCSSGKRIEAHKFYEHIGYPENIVKGFKKFL
ncbi:MAG: Acetyltransferase family protein [Firmicutes bacterium]|nr:Acetyltransferase family protein [Bacillota bacterium]